MGVTSAHPAEKSEPVSPPNPPTPASPSTPTTAPSGRPLSEAEVSEAEILLRGGVMFRSASAESLRAVARGMVACDFARGDDLVSQGAPSTCFWVLARGDALRLRADRDGTRHVVNSAAACGTTINSLQLLSGDAVYATARCASDACRAFGMARETFIAQLERDPALARGVIASLSRDARKKSKLFRTPLLMQQQSTGVNYSAVTIAAAVESYYRSALNSLLNQRLSGVKAPLLPNMHVQVPARVMYINGFKGLRAFLDQRVHTEDYTSSKAARFATLVGPGIIMTPVSSFLEACNAGHQNPEPLLRRSLRGTLPRCVREIIFGVGLNQVSDYFTERFRTMSPSIQSLQVSSSPIVGNMAGSVTAGVFAGYLSHVPHNISTYKLLHPEQSYRQLFAKFVDSSVPERLVPKRGLPAALLPAARVLLACVFPRGVAIRTAQIVGSFVILNGTIHALQEVDQKRMVSSLADSLDRP